MTSYIQRTLEKKILEYLDIFPVLGITGPRQAGKSTLLRKKFQNYEYVTFDDYSHITSLSQDPTGFMKRYNKHVIFDEVQKVPELFSLVKLIVDQNRQEYGQFILTGSSNFQILQSISESLAGRIGLLTLLPLQFSEIPGHLRQQAQWQGSYPEVIMRDYKQRDAWYSSYISTYIDKDVRAISQIGDLRDFQRFMQFLAINTSHILNQTTCSREVGVSVPTIKRWLSVLEASYIIFLLSPFYANFGKRLTRSPKIYFYDTGVAAHLAGLDSELHYNQGPMGGALFENYVVAEAIKRATHLKTRDSFYYLRTTHGVEVDLIIDKGQYKEFIEIKKGSTFKPSMIQGMRGFLTEQDRGYLVYQGKDAAYNEQIQILSLEKFLL